MTFFESLLAFFGAALLQDDLASVTAGVLVAQGEVGFLPAALGCLAGTLLADLVWCFGARWLGRRALGIPPFSLFVSEQRLAICQRWLTDQGNKTIFLCRFMTGLRTPLLVAIGILHLDLRRTIFTFVLAATVYVGCVVGGIALAGDMLGKFAITNRPLRPLAVAAIGLVLWAAFHFFKRVVESRVTARLRGTPDQGPVVPEK